MEENKMRISPDDFKLLGDKYDPQDVGVIYYNFFCDDIDTINLTTEDDLNRLVSIIYTNIRKKFKTIDKFF